MGRSSMLNTKDEPTTEDGHGQQTSTSLVFAWVILSVGVGAFFSLAIDSQSFAFRTFPDDAMFYFTIARNICSGAGSTIDGISKTNGYHPLWMIVLLGLSKCFQNLVRAGIVTEFVVSAGTLTMLCLYARKYLGTTAALALAIIASFEQTWYKVMYCGMESGLVIFFLLLSLYVLREAGHRAAWRWILSACLCLFFLARLDGWALCLAIVPAMWMTPGPIPADGKRKGRLLAEILALPTLTLAGYLLFNLANYSSVMPVSGLIKSYHLEEFTRLDTAEYLQQAAIRFFNLYAVYPFFLAVKIVFGRNLYEGRLSWIHIIYCLGVVALLVTFARRLRRTGQIDVSLWALAWLVVLRAGYYALLQKDTYSLGMWVKGPGLLALSLAGCALCVQVVGPLWKKDNLHLVTASYAALLLMGVEMHHLRNLRLDRLQDYSISAQDFRDAIVYVHDQVPAETVLASHNVGFFSYYSGHPTISVDGLVNSYRYYIEYKARNRELDYLRVNGVRWLIEKVEKEEPSLDGIQRLYPGLASRDVRILKEFDLGQNNPLINGKYVFAELMRP